MEASLIKNDIAQQKSSVTLTLIHAAPTPPCIDSPLTNALKRGHLICCKPHPFSNISQCVTGRMLRRTFAAKSLDRQLDGYKSEFIAAPMSESAKALHGDEMR